MSGVEDLDGMDVVRNALDAAHGWRLARQHVVRVFEEYDPPRLVRSRGILRCYDGRFFHELRPDVPFGWTTRRVLCMDAITVMPYWWAWALDLGEARYGVFRLAMHLGLWCVPLEGDYYVNGRLTAPRWLRRAFWCFINDRDRAPALDENVVFTTPAQRSAISTWVRDYMTRRALEYMARPWIPFSADDPG